MQRAMNPRVLLVEDDDISRQVLASAVARLPASVDAAASARAAVRLAAAGRHQAWLIDAHLPDGDGPTLLGHLRELDATTPALAHTASRDRALLDRLVDAGFAEVLIKPFSAAELHAVLRRTLGIDGPTETATPSRCGKLPPWDDETALRALGDRRHVDEMRRLFVQELRGQRDTVLSALREGDGAAAEGQLHRLRASCGFVGAPRLEAAMRELQADPDSASARRLFAEAVEDALASAGVAAPEAPELGEHVP